MLHHIGMFESRIMFDIRLNFRFLAWSPEGYAHEECQEKLMSAEAAIQKHFWSSLHPTIDHAMSRNSQNDRIASLHDRFFAEFLEQVWQRRRALRIDDVINLREFNTEKQPDIVKSPIAVGINEPIIDLLPLLRIYSNITQASISGSSRESVRGKWWCDDGGKEPYSINLKSTNDFQMGRFSIFSDLCGS